MHIVERVRRKRRLTHGARSYDVDGRIARQGRVHAPLLDELMTHPFFARTPPKSGGRAVFGAEYVDRLMGRRAQLGISDEHLVATVTAFTAEAIATQMAAFVRPRVRVDEIVVGGGGVHNPALMDMLQARVGRLQTLEALGFDVDSKEPMMFAVLANEAVHGGCGNVPEATGARHPVVLGSITPGGNGGRDGPDRLGPRGRSRD